MQPALRKRIANHLLAAGYPAAEINRGIAYAASTGYRDDDEALSLVASRILYDDAALAGGARFAVEPGTW
jgi:hypothetical protein